MFKLSIPQLQQSLGNNLEQTDVGNTISHSSHQNELYQGQLFAAESRWQALLSYTLHITYASPIRATALDKNKPNIFHFNYTWGQTKNLHCLNYTCCTLLKKHKGLEENKCKKQYDLNLCMGELSRTEYSGLIQLQRCFLTGNGSLSNSRTLSRTSQKSHFLQNQ